MREQLRELYGMPDALAALKLTPGASTSRSVHVCSQNSEHDVIEISLIAWNPVFQRAEVKGHTKKVECNYCSGTIGKKSLSIRNARAIRSFLGHLDEDCRHLEKLLEGTSRKPWKRHVCTSCGSAEIQGKGWVIHDLDELSYNIAGTWSGVDHEKGRCTFCKAKSSKMVEMSNHERLVAADRMRAELARLRAERAEIDSWLTAHGHIYCWAPPG